MKTIRLWLSLILFGLGGVLTPGCDKEDPVAGTPAVSHPLSAAVTPVRASLTGISEDELEAIDAFVRHADPSATPFEVRRICGFLGRGLSGADPDVVAEFVLAAAPSLHTQFFGSFTEEQLFSVAGALRHRPGMGEIERFRMEMIIRLGRGVYEGTLANAMSEVSFAEAIAPRRRPLAELMPAADASIEAVSGAAEIIRLDAFVEEGAQPAVSIELYRQGLERWPNEPVLLAGLVCVSVENEDEIGAELENLLAEAAVADPENAAYCYLLAIRQFLTGRDEEALAQLAAGAERPDATLHSIVRSARTAAYLESLGVGPVRARLAAYRASSLAPHFDLKRLADRAVKRSIEYEEGGNPEALELVLQFPLTLDRQLGTGVQTVFARHIRNTVLTTGLARLATYHRKTDPVLAKKLTDRAARIAADAESLEKGESMCGGQDAWVKYYDLLGEEDFLGYVDRVLFGDEAAFLTRCSALDSIEQSVELTRQKW